MNIKRGLERIWIVVSVLWVVGIILMGIYSDKQEQEMFYFYGVVSLFVWWGLLYTGFWISSGFSSDKKKDETNE